MNRERLESKSYKDYKEAIKEETKELKQKLRGKMIWNSNQGTYIREKYGIIGNE